MRWTANLAYAIGLLTSDGCLSIDGRHITLTSKDIEQIENFKLILKLKNKIGFKYRGEDHSKVYYNLQFGSVKFYQFLVSIGLTPHKSKTIGAIEVPDKYFRDFLRGSFDGDGYSISYWSKQWPNSFVLYTGFTSASKQHLVWMKDKILNLFGISGYIGSGGKGAYLLRFAKKSSLSLVSQIYHNTKVKHLKRKRFKVELALGIIQRQQNARVAERFTRTPKERVEQSMQVQILSRAPRSLGSAG